MVTPQATIPVTGPVGMASDGESVWLFTAAGQLVRIDPTTNTIGTSVTLSPATGYYQGIAVNKAGLWITEWNSSVVERFDPTTLKAVATIAVGPNPKGVLATDAGVWVANTRGGSVARIDPATNTVVATISVGPTGPSGPNWLAEGLGSIWVGVPNASSVVRIDEATNDILARIGALGTSPCGGLVVGQAAVWITSCDGGNLLARIDPTRNSAVTTVDLGGHAYTVVLLAGAPWTWPTGGLLVRIDPATNAINRAIAPGSRYGSLGGDVVVAAGSMWLMDGANNQVIRLPLSALGG
jgi:YVTN family beta-propeller protein